MLSNDREHEGDGKSVRRRHLHLSPHASKIRLNSSSLSGASTRQCRHPPLHRTCRARSPSPARETCRLKKQTRIVEKTTPFHVRMDIVHPKISLAPFGLRSRPAEVSPAF